MLGELKNLECRGGKAALLFFICDVIGCNRITIRDAEILCAHAPGSRQLSAVNIINYCLAFKWICVDADTITISQSLIKLIGDKEALNDKLIMSTVEQLFTGEIFNPSMFSYDAVKSCYSFKNELLPLYLSGIRNVLISQGFLIPFRDKQTANFFIAPAYEVLIAKYCKDKRKLFSIEMLKKQLEDNEIAGEKAELFVLSFEKRRIGSPLCENIKRISEIDASAGYDVVSFNSCRSQAHDRFIEVKAVSNSGFYWSRNEYEIAKLKGEQYYLYLVELSRINDSEYIPEMIQNPASAVMNADEWFVEAQTYHIKHV